MFGISAEGNGENWSGRPDSNRRTPAPKSPQGKLGNPSKERISSILNELSSYTKFAKYPEFGYFVNLLVAFWSQISENDLSDDPCVPEDER